MVQSIGIIMQSFERAGSQRQALEILKAASLWGNGIDYTLIIVGNINLQSDNLCAEAAANNVRLCFLPFKTIRFGGSSLIARFLDFLLRKLVEPLINLKLLIRIRTLDSVVFFEPYACDLISPFLRHSQRICFHLVEHWSQRDVHPYCKIITSRRVNVIYLHPGQVLQLPQGKLRDSATNKPIWTLRLCSDSFFAPTVRPAILPEQVMTIAHYSRISPMRKIHYILDAFAILHAKRPARLNIYGAIQDEDYFLDLKLKAESLSINKAVQFLPPVTRPLTADQIIDVNLVWMIALSGHIGYAGIEAMAAGQPTFYLEVDENPFITDNPYVYQSGHELADASSQALKRLPSLAEEQYQFALKNYRMQKYDFLKLQAFYLGVT